MESIIQIETLDALIGILGVIAALGVAWGSFRGRLETISRDVSEIKPEVKESKERLIVVEEQVKNMKSRFDVIEDRVDDLWLGRIAPKHSPRKLNETGQKILQKSGIKEIIDSHDDELFQTVQDESPSNPYDAERTIEEVAKEIPKDIPEVMEELKTKAYYLGESVDSVLYVGAIYMRDKYFPRLGFAVTDIEDAAPVAQPAVMPAGGTMSHNINDPEDYPTAGDKMMEGVIIQESLEDATYVNSLTITGTRVSKLDNPAPHQNPVWTMHNVVVDPAEIKMLSKQLQIQLKTGPWYIAFKNDDRVVVIFKDRIFDYERLDSETTTKAKSHGRSLGVPDSQLDW